MAGGNAGLATGAAVERDFERVLFAVAGFRQRNQAAIVVSEIGLALVMNFRKPGDGRLKLLLLGEKLVDEIARFDTLPVGTGKGRNTFKGGRHREN